MCLDDDAIDLNIKFDYTRRPNRREIKYIDTIIVHCSASDRPEDDDISVIKDWHIKRGFAEVGYHYFVKRDGTIQKGRDMYKIGAHCIGHNLYSVGICVAGNHIFSDDALKGLYTIIKNTMYRVNVKKERVLPHSYFDKQKTCPNFSLDKIWQFET